MVGNNGRPNTPIPNRNSRQYGPLDICYPVIKPEEVLMPEFRFQGVNDELRAKFQSAFPFPQGVKWDGDFIHGSNEVIGSFRNATEWSAMWRGFRRAWELANGKG